MKVEALRPGHARAAFRSGEAVVDKYFKSQAGRDTAKGLAAVFVLVLPDHRLAGFYTLAPATVFLPDLLSGAAHRVSRYPALPAARLSRLVVDARHRGRGYGHHLVDDALARVQGSRFESVAVIAEAPEAAAQAFYVGQGFQAFPDRPDRLFRAL